MSFRSNRENQVTRQDLNMPRHDEPFREGPVQKADHASRDARSTAVAADGFQTLDVAEPGKERRGLSAPRSHGWDY